jgi:hypothetical protein
MNDLYGWKNGWKIMNFIMNVANKHYFFEKINKKNKVETIYVGFFQNNLTN